jgi:hypothetical protein
MRILEIVDKFAADSLLGETLTIVVFVQGAITEG